MAYFKSEQFFKASYDESCLWDNYSPEYYYGYCLFNFQIDGTFFMIAETYYHKGIPKVV